MYHEDDRMVNQPNLKSDEFITYLIDSVHNKLESDNTEKGVTKSIVAMAVLDFSTDVVEDPGFLAVGCLNLFCFNVFEY